MIDQVVSEIVGKARPLVDRAIDEAALIALDTVWGTAENLRNATGAVGDSLPDQPSAYMAGWDDALAALQLAIRGITARIKEAGGMTWREEEPKA